MALLCGRDLYFVRDDLRSDGGKLSSLRRYVSSVGIFQIGRLHQAAAIPELIRRSAFDHSCSSLLSVTVAGADGCCRGDCSGDDLAGDWSEHALPAPSPSPQSDRAITLGHCCVMDCDSVDCLVDGILCDRAVAENVQEGTC